MCRPRLQLCLTEHTACHRGSSWLPSTAEAVIPGHPMALASPDAGDSCCSWGARSPTASPGLCHGASASLLDSFNLGTGTAPQAASAPVASPVFPVLSLSCSVWPSIPPATPPETLTQYPGQLSALGNTEAMSRAQLPDSREILPRKLPLNDVGLFLITTDASAPGDSAHCTFKAMVCYTFLVSC